MLVGRGLMGPSQKLESIFNGLASYFPLDVDMIWIWGLGISLNWLWRW